MIPDKAAGQRAWVGFYQKTLTGVGGVASYVNVINIHINGGEKPSMSIAAKLDDWGKPAWITVVILGFLLFWPIGLAILAYLIWSGRIMARWTRGGWRRWGCARTENSWAEREWRRWQARDGSGNAAFDEYREETLKRLEEEQAEFQGFLDQLRKARDKAEFEQFMAERRRRAVDPETAGPRGPDASPQGAAAPA